MKSELLEKIGEKYLVKVEKADRVEYVICADYDETREEGSKWSYGHYFGSIRDAVMSQEKPKSYYSVIIIPDDSLEREYAVVDDLEEAYSYVENFLRYITDDEDDIKELLHELKQEKSVDSEDYGMIMIDEYFLGDNITD